jgi:hypothetical protein
MIRGLLYRTLMKLAHRFHWHYAPPVYPDGDTQLWCKWCGFRETIKRRTRTIAELEQILAKPDEAYRIEVQPDGSINAVEIENPPRPK